MNKLLDKIDAIQITPELIFIIAISIMMIVTAFMLIDQLIANRRANKVTDRLAKLLLKKLKLIHERGVLIKDISDVHKNMIESQRKADYSHYPMKWHYMLEYLIHRWCKIMLLKGLTWNTTQLTNMNYFKDPDDDD